MKRRSGIAWLAILALAHLAPATLSAAPPQTASTEGPTASPGESPASTEDAAPAHRLRVTLTPETVTIGDRVEALITLETDGPIAGPPRFPVWETHWGDAEILAAETPAQEEDGRWHQRLELAVFETGIATLRAVEVEVPGPAATSTARTAPATIDVESILPAEGGEEVAPLPPEPVRPLPTGSTFWWAASLLALACAVLAFLLWRSVSRVRAALAALSRSPLESFQLALERLRGEVGVERVYTGLSLELRRYIGRSLGFPAAEGTTTQIQRALRERNLPAELVRDTLELLREADQIKFARGSADRERLGRRLDDAERLVQEVEAWLEPDAAESEVAA